MKTITLGEAQERLLELVRLVAAGEEIELVEQERAVARLVPADRETRKVDWSGTWAKADAIFGGKNVPGKPGSQVVIEGRR